MFSAHCFRGHFTLSFLSMFTAELFSVIPGSASILHMLNNPCHCTYKASNPPFRKWYPSVLRATLLTLLLCLWKVSPPPTPLTPIQTCTTFTELRGPPPRRPRLQDKLWRAWLSDQGLARAIFTKKTGCNFENDFYVSKMYRRIYHKGGRLLHHKHSRYCCR